MFFGEKAVSRTSCLEHKNGRFTYEPSVLCSMFAKKATAAKNNCSADDFLLLPFLSRKKRKGGRFLFLKKRNKRHCGGEGSFGEKALSRTSDPIAQKNGRFPYEPSVLCSMFAKKTTAAKSNCSADDFLLRGRFARESWRAGAADTGRDKAEEGGIPAAVFRPTTTQDVPASVRLSGCASRASRPCFLSRKKRKRKITRQCMDFSSLRTGGMSETITQSSVSTPTVSRL